VKSKGSLETSNRMH